MSQRDPDHLPSESCNSQTALFGGTSCTVHNYPNNNGSVEYSESSKLYALALIAIVAACLTLICLCKMYLSTNIQPPRTIPRPLIPTRRPAETALPRRFPGSYRKADAGRGRKETEEYDIEIC